MKHTNGIESSVNPGGSANLSIAHSLRNIRFCLNPRPTIAPIRCLTPSLMPILSRRVTGAAFKPLTFLRRLRRRLLAVTGGRELATKLELFANVSGKLLVVIGRALTETMCPAMVAVVLIGLLQITEFW